MFRQQGDVLFNKVGEVPSGAQVVAPEGGRFVLAKGEATGHAHAVEVKPHVQLFAWDGKFYLETGEVVAVFHEEHGTVTLEPGIWEVGLVQEYDHFREESRAVAD